MKWSFIVLIILYLGIVNEGCASSPPQKTQTRANVAVKRGIDLYKQGQLDAAENVFRRILTRNSQNLVAKEMLAVIALRKKNMNEAEKFAVMAIRQNNKSVRGHAVLAVIRKSRGQNLAALDHARKVKRFVKNDTEKIEMQRFFNNYELEERSKPEKIETKYKVEVEGEKPYVAVFTFEDKTESAKLGGTVTEMFITALIQSNRFKVLERSQLDKILEEQALGQTGALDEQTAVEVGQLIGVDAIIVGSVSMLQRQLELDSRAIDAVSGEAHIAASKSAANESKIRDAVNDMAKQLALHADRIPVQREEQSDSIEP
jgi:TolB-like protein